ncbi:ABC transporter substrate-binding protein [Pseudoalteromonas ostreae]|uniref:ABC transporter substrate-binding protein n=1 Tax=Pseudoalteromonas ostreae TaxID=2774154 RepID=UPI001B393B67|nr:ABC transporter substrate-binding protein [Pseudoalteromonas ostreae]
MKYFLIIILVGFTFHLNAQDKSFSVLFVNPSVEGDPFWGKVQNIMTVAAKQNNIALDVIYGEGNRYIQLAELKKYLQYRASPDYVVLLNYPGGAEQSLNLLEQYKVKFITLEQTIIGEERNTIGDPKQHYKFWLGEIYHDNFIAGKKLAQTLITSAQQRNIIPHVIAINGHYGSESDARSDGLKSYLTENKLELSQTVYASWSKPEAMEKTRKLIQRYPQTNIIWSASDLMALGAYSAVKNADQKNYIIGGFDWLNDNLRLIKQGKITASVGGHFMMGGWALITLVDLHDGIDYWQRHTAIAIDLDVITAKNIAQYEHLIDVQDWSFIDFSRYRLQSKGNVSYQFNVKNLRKD